MSTSLIVEKQRFEFGERWSAAFKYDESTFYRQGPERLKGDLDERSGSETKSFPQATRAMDVVGLHADVGLLLLEAKDFRGHRIENKHRMSGQVSLEVALKVRDTLAGLLGAASKAESEFPSDSLVSALKPNQPLTVVLWLEDDTLSDEKKAKATLNQLNSLLKVKLSWLNVRTLVQSSRAPQKVRDLVVTNLIGAGQS